MKTETLHTYLTAHERHHRIYLNMRAAHAALLSISDDRRTYRNERMSLEQRLVELKQNPAYRVAREPALTHARTALAEIETEIALKKRLEELADAMIETYRAEWDALSKQVDSTVPILKSLADEVRREGRTELSGLMKEYFASKSVDGGLKHARG